MQNKFIKELPSLFYIKGFKGTRNKMKQPTSHSMRNFMTKPVKQVNRDETSQWQVNGRMTVTSRKLDCHRLTTIINSPSFYSPEWPEGFWFS